MDILDANGDQDFKYVFSVYFFAFASVFDPP